MRMSRSLQGVDGCVCVLQGIELKSVRRMSQSSQVSIDNALINVAKSQISTSMTKLNQNEVHMSVSPLFFFFTFTEIFKHSFESLHLDFDGIG